MNPDSIIISMVTAEEFTDGHYRHPRPLSDGTLVASHTTYNDPSDNIGSRAEPESPFQFRIKILDKSGDRWTPGDLLTDGIHKPVQFWDPDVLVTYRESVPMWEFSPVEVTSRPRPSSTQASLEAPERQIFEEEEIDIDALKEFLRENELALVVSRNVTTRDAADKQQPYNLRVAENGVETTGSSGKMYEISHLQFFQGDQIRGYDGISGGGRRVIAPANAR